MKFEIRFEADRSLIAYYAIYINSADTGLNGVRKIRKELETDKLSSERIRDYKKGLETNPQIKILESIAISSGRFDERNIVKVVVRHKALNKFVYEVVECDKDEQTGEITHAWIERKLNEQAVLNAWEDAGYPLEWNVEDEEL